MAAALDQGPEHFCEEHQVLLPAVPPGTARHLRGAGPVHLRYGQPLKLNYFQVEGSSLSRELNWIYPKISHRIFQKRLAYNIILKLCIHNNYKTPNSLPELSTSLKTL